MGYANPIRAGAGLTAPSRIAPGFRSEAGILGLVGRTTSLSAKEEGGGGGGGARYLVTPPLTLPEAPVPTPERADGFIVLRTLAKARSFGRARSCRAAVLWDVSEVVPAPGAASKVP